MLTMQCKDDKWTRIRNISFNDNKTPIKKHVTFKYERNLKRLASIYEKNGGQIEFKFMETERYEQHLTYFGDYQIRQSLIIDMKKARMVEPYLVGRSIREEVEHKFHVPLLHGTFCTGFSSNQLIQVS
jgi:hypothetical protein